MNDAWTPSEAGIVATVSSSFHGGFLIESWILNVLI